MSCIATRPTEDIVRGLESIEELPTVAETMTTKRATSDAWERVAVVRLADGIERIPPEVCRAIGESDFGVDSLERYPGDEGYLEVVLR